MILQYSPYFLPLLISTFFLAALTVISWRFRTRPEGCAVILFLTAATIWSAASAGNVVSTDIFSNYLFIAFAYLGIVTVPVAWMLLVIIYIGEERTVSFPKFLAFFIIPALTCLMVFTNPYHHLYYSAVTVVQQGSSVIWLYSYGPFFWIHALYSYILVLSGMILLLTRYRTAQAIFRAQIALLLIAVALPFGFNLLWVVYDLPFPGFDPTPVIFIPTGLILIAAASRYQLFSLSPVAYSMLFDSLNDSVVVTNERGLVVSINTAGAGMLGELNGKILGRPVHETLHGIPSGFLTCSHDSHMECNLSFKSTDPPQQYDIRCMPILSEKGDITGRILVIRNIQEAYLAESALVRTNQKLNLLNDITRHDMLNTLTALLLNLEYAKDIPHTPEMEDIIQRTERTAQILLEQVEFTRDYQDLGVNTPIWQDAGKVLDKVLSMLSLTDISIKSNFDGILVYADPLFGKVLYNLADNAVRHGKNLNCIRFDYAKDPEGLILSVEDNGTGISPDLKEKIFQRGYGKGSGLGLFLAREILSITGIRIKETGIPGKGARFEIQVPPGSYRMPGSQQ
jgi:signal transduction histidine kinase